MAGKKSIYLSTAAEAVIGILPEDGNLSGRINSIIVRYGEITAKDCPVLSAGEWMAIIDILNSTWKETESAQQDIARYLWAEIEESIPDGIEDKWNIDAHSLSQQIKIMSYAQQCAIIEVVCRFWQGHDSQEWDSDADRLKHFGAKLST